MTNPLTDARRQAQFWRFAFWLTVPGLIVAVMFLTSQVHAQQVQTDARITKSFSVSRN